MYLLPNFTDSAQAANSSLYKAAIDESVTVHDKVAGAFHVYEAATPNMTVVINDGEIQSGKVSAGVSETTTSLITAPVTDPRIDLIVIDKTTGVHSILPGVESAIPAPAAIPSNKIILAEILLQTTTTEIVNSMISDRRPAFESQSIDTDTTLAANSDDVVPSQKAVKTYADTKRVLVMLDTPIVILNVISVGGSWITHDLSTTAPSVVNDGAKEIIVGMYLEKTINSVGSFYMACAFRRVGSTASFTSSSKVRFDSYSWGTTLHNEVVQGEITVGLDANGDFQIYITNGGVGGTALNTLHVVGYYK